MCYNKTIKRGDALMVNRQNVVYDRMAYLTADGDRCVVVKPHDKDFCVICVLKNSEWSDEMIVSYSSLQPRK